MKIGVRVIAIELAIEKGEDFDNIPHWKTLKYEVEASKIIRIMNRLSRNIKKIKREKSGVVLECPVCDGDHVYNECPDKIKGDKYGK